MPRLKQRSTKPEPALFIIMVKPAGPACNYACEYCYYLDKKDLFGRPARLCMNEQVLEPFIRDYFATAQEQEVVFLWHGGEPTLLGLDYFKTAFALPRHHCPPGRRFVNLLQTHGSNLNAEWAQFFKFYEVLIGLSIDGPKEVNELARKDQTGRSTFPATRRAVKLLRYHGVEFNTLTVVHAGNYQRGAAIDLFLRRTRVRHMKSIPLIERCDEAGEDVGPPPSTPASMAPLSWPKDKRFFRGRKPNFQTAAPNAQSSSFAMEVVRNIVLFRVTIATAWTIIYAHLIAVYTLTHVPGEHSRLASKRYH